MKIIHEENGKEVVYVQLGDIAFINSNIDIAIPASIFLSAFSGDCTVVDNSNRFDFLRFELPKEVEFLKNLDLIIDYKNYKDLNKKQLKKKLIETLKETARIETTYNNMSKEDKLKNSELPGKHLVLCQAIQEIQKLYLLKAGKIKMKFPEGV